MSTINGVTIPGTYPQLATNTAVLNSTGTFQLATSGGTLAALPDVTSAGDSTTVITLYDSAASTSLETARQVAQFTGAGTGNFSMPGASWVGATAGNNVTAAVVGAYFVNGLYAVVAASSSPTVSITYAGTVP
jgi:hypothetical protein